MVQPEKNERKKAVITGNVKAGNDCSASAKSPLQRKKEKRVFQKKVSAKKVLELCEDKVSLEKISNLLGISTVSVATYIERLLRKGKPVDIEFYIPYQKRIEIEEAFLTLQTSSIKHISEYLKDGASVEEIRMVRGYLQNRQASDF